MFWSARDAFKILQFLFLESAVSWLVCDMEPGNVTPEQRSALLVSGSHTFCACRQGMNAFLLHPHTARGSLSKEPHRPEGTNVLSQTSSCCFFLFAFLTFPPLFVLGRVMQLHFHNLTLLFQRIAHLENMVALEHSHLETGNLSWV